MIAAGAVGREVALARFAEPVRVLDHGFVQLVDLMGDDEAIEEAARVSYAKGTRSRSDRRALLRYLLRHRHTSPFEMVELKIRVKLPIFVERQWVRHRMASLNEVSARYSELPEEVYIPTDAQVCAQSKTNKQGRAAPVDSGIAEAFRMRLAEETSRAFCLYRDVLSEDVARETARIGLPLGTFTEKIWKIDGHNLLHFLSLRLDAHAQWEIRQYAEAIAEIVKVWLPLTWEAFVDYRLEAATLSRMELDVVRWLVAGHRQFFGEIVDAALRVECERAGMTGREIGEFLARFVQSAMGVA